MSEAGDELKDNMDILRDIAVDRQTENEVASIAGMFAPRTAEEKQMTKKAIRPATDNLLIIWRRLALIDDDVKTLRLLSRIEVERERADRCVCPLSLTEQSEHDAAMAEKENPNA